MSARRLPSMLRAARRSSVLQSYAVTVGGHPDAFEYMAYLSGCLHLKRFLDLEGQPWLKLKQSYFAAEIPQVGASRFVTMDS